MTYPSIQCRVEEYGRGVRCIKQKHVPFNTPLGLPFANPFADKQMLFRRQYKLTGVDLEEAREGIMFGNYRHLMDIKKETYSRKQRKRYLIFNPFTKEMERMGRRAGELGAKTGRGIAALMVKMLGLIEWEVSEDPSTSEDEATINIKVTNKLFFGCFKIRIRRTPDGVILEDDWCPEGGADMRTKTLAMANVVLATHPKGFEQIAAQVVEEIDRAKRKGRTYIGEIGPPSEEGERVF